MSRCCVPMGGLYPILDDGFVPLDAMALAATALWDAGCGWVQLRLGMTDDRGRLAVQRSVARAASRREACVIINDRVDLAAVLADESPALSVGVHLGQDDVAPAVAREILGADAVLGWSTHDLRQVRAACHMPVDYLGFGPVFPTGTKDDTAPLVGIEGLRDAVAEAGLPVVAIGGITGERAVAVRQTGAAGVAMISGLYEGLDLGLHGAWSALEGRARSLRGMLS